MIHSYFSGMSVEFHCGAPWIPPSTRFARSRISPGVKVPGETIFDGLRIALRVGFRVFERPDRGEIVLPQILGGLPASKQILLFFFQRLNLGERSVFGASFGFRIHAPFSFSSDGLGRATVNAPPSPGRDSTQMVPPWARTISWQIASPNPVPPGRPRT